MSLFLGLAMNAAVSLSGKYVMEIDINGKVFEDNLEMQGVKIPMSLFGAGKIKGTLTVPDIFSSPLTGTYACSMWVNKCRVNFEILAVENGKEYKVYYDAALEARDFIEVMNGHPAILTGKARLENGSLLGTFKAVQVHE